MTNRFTACLAAAILGMSASSALPADPVPYYRLRSGAQSATTDPGPASPGSVPSTPAAGGNSAPSPAPKASFASNPAPVRAGSPFSVPVNTTPQVAGSWSTASSPADVAFSGVTGGVLSGTAPASVSGSPSPRTLTATFLGSDPSTPGSSATTTLDVYPALAFASSPSPQAGTVGTQIAAFSPPPVSGRVGTLTYALFQGSANVTDSLGSVCGGLQFSAATGQVSGTPTTACSPTLGYAVTDDGGGAPTLAATAASGTFPLTVTNAIPAQFSFSPVSNATGATTYSATANLAGMTAPGALSVTGGSGYAVAVGINGASPSTTIPDTVPASARLTVQVPSAPGTNGGTRTATVTVSGVTATFAVTTADTTPDAFAWPTRTGYQENVEAVSSDATITGLTAPATATVSGPGTTYLNVGGTGWTTGPVTVLNGQTVAVKVTTAGTGNTSATATVTIGGVVGYFSAITDNDVPDNLDCASGTNRVFPANGGQEYYCDIQLSGMKVPATWAATGSFSRVYTVATGWTTASSGTIAPNARIILAVVAPAGTNGGTNAGNLRVSSSQQWLYVQTGDTTPDPFGFEFLSNQPINTFVGSSTATIAGIDQPTPVSVSGGVVSINGANWTTGGTVYKGQTIRLGQTTSGAYNSSTAATVNVGGVTATWYASTGNSP